MNQNDWPYGSIDTELDRLEAMISFEFLGGFEDFASVLEPNLTTQGKRDYLSLLKAQRFQQKGRFDEAQQILSGLNRSYPGNERILCELGFALLNLAREEEALDCFAQVRGDQEHRATAICGVGMIAVHRGDKQRARELFEEANRLNPLSTRAVEELASLVAEDPVAAREVYPRVAEYLRAEPFDVPVRLWAVILLTCVGDANEARDQLAIAKAIQPASSKIAELERKLTLS